jgi:hypothetical protein
VHLPRNTGIELQLNGFCHLDKNPISQDPEQALKTARLGA